MILSAYNKSNLQVEDFLPHIDRAVAQAKALDTPSEPYPTGLGSHIYQLIEKLQQDETRGLESSTQDDHASI